MAGLLSNTCTSSISTKSYYSRNVLDTSRNAPKNKGLKNAFFYRSSAIPSLPLVESSKRFSKCTRLEKIRASENPSESVGSGENSNFGLLLPRHIAIAAAVFSMHIAIAEIALCETSQITESEALRQNLLQMIKTRKVESPSLPVQTAPPLISEPAESTAPVESVSIPATAPTEEVSQPVETDSIIKDKIDNEIITDVDIKSASETSPENEPIQPIEPASVLNEPNLTVETNSAAEENSPFTESVSASKTASESEILPAVQTTLGSETVLTEEIDPIVEVNSIPEYKNEVVKPVESDLTPVESIPTDESIPPVDSNVQPAEVDSPVENLVNRFLNLIPAQGKQDTVESSIINESDIETVNNSSITEKENSAVEDQSSPVNELIDSEQDLEGIVQEEKDSDGGFDLNFSDGIEMMKELKPKEQVVNLFKSFFNSFPSVNQQTNTQSKNEKGEELYEIKDKNQTSNDMIKEEDSILQNNTLNYEFDENIFDEDESVSDKDKKVLEFKVKDKDVDGINGLDLFDSSQNEKIFDTVGSVVKTTEELVNKNNLGLIGLSVLPSALFGGLWYSERQKNKQLFSNMEDSLQEKITKIKLEKDESNSDFQEQISKLKNMLDSKQSEQSDIMKELENKKIEMIAMNDEVESFKKKFEVVIISQERLENELVVKEKEKKILMDEIGSLKSKVESQQSLITDGEEKVILLKNQLSEEKRELKEKEEEMELLKKSVLEKEAMAERLDYSATEVENLKMIIHEKEKEVENRENEIENIKNELSSSQKNVLEKENEVNSLKNDVEFLIEKSANKTKEMEVMAASLTEVEVKNDEYLKAIMDKEIELNSLKIIIENMDNSMNENNQKMEILSSNVNRFETELRKAMEEKKKKEEELAMAVRTLEDMENSLEREREKEEVTKNEIENLTRILKIKEDESAQYLSRIDDLEEEVQESSQLIVKMKGEISSLKQSISEQSAIVAELKSSLSDTKTVLGEKEKRESELESMVARLHEKERENEDLQQKMEDLKTTVKNLKGNLQVEQQISATAGAQLANSQNALEEEKKIMEVLKKGLEEASEGLDTLNSEIRNLSFQLESAREEMEKKEKQVIELKELLEIEKEKVNKLELELSGSQQSIAELIEEKKKLTSKVADLEFTVNASNEELLLLKGKATELSRNMEIAKIKLESIAVVRAEAAWMVEQFEDEAAKEKEEKETFKKKYEVLEAKTRAASTMAFELKSVKNELLQVQDSLNAAQAAREEVERAASALNSLASEPNPDLDLDIDLANESNTSIKDNVNADLSEKLDKEMKDEEGLEEKKMDANQLLSEANALIMNASSDLVEGDKDK